MCKRSNAFSLAVLMAEGLITWYGELDTFRHRENCRRKYKSLFVGILTNKYCLLVIGATGVHTATSRTRSLSLSAPMVLGG
jgi:hypothetical protein